MARPDISLIDGYFYGFVGISNFSASGGSGNLTTAIGTALSTAGKGGTSVPTQVIGSGQGVAVTTPDNRVLIINRSSGEPLEDSNGRQIYGTLTHSAGTYTVTYYTQVNATETPYSFGSATAVDLRFAYRFSLGRLPENFAISIPSRSLNQDSQGGSAAPQWELEKLTVTALNTLSALTKTPSDANKLILFVRGITFDRTSGASSAFSVSDKTITWSAVNSEVDLQVGWHVAAFYPTLE